jgi:hypothetical protein
MLTAIKLLHTLIWAVLAACIVALPVVGMLRRFRWAAILTGIVLLECAVLAINGGMPLVRLGCQVYSRTLIQLRYLPAGLVSEHNKVVFGVLFVAGEFVVLARWLMERYGGTSEQSKQGIF